MPSEIKRGVSVDFSYISQDTQELFGSWIFDNERLSPRILWGPKTSNSPKYYFFCQIIP